MSNEYEYTGFESAFVPTPPGEKQDKDIDRKTKKSDTPKKDPEKTEFVSSGKKNVLSSYRSYTYNFVLAALHKDIVNDPARYRNSELDLVILRSGGKGQDGIASVNWNKEEAIINATTNENDRLKALEDFKSRASTLRALEQFNKESPGRFDMFIDDVEIETIMAFSQQGGTTQPTSIRFEVIEPYSINGFLEALQVAAVRAGYTNYATASFLLKVQFVGYKDDVQLPDPEFIEKSERYFVFGFNGCEVEVTERGTKYRCTGVPYNEKAYGQPGKLKKAVKMSGDNVREILKDLMESVTDLEIQNAKKTKAVDYDEYKIKFIRPSISGSSLAVSNLTWVDDSEGAIAKSKLSDLGTDSVLYQMIDPSQKGQKKTNYKTTEDVAPSGDTVKDEKKFEPKKTVTQFPENVSLHEIIAAVIRDSEYVSKLIEEIKPDSSGMIDYFVVRTEITNKSNTDPKTKKPYQIFTYVVTPHKIHFTNIPNFESSLVSEQSLKRSTLREYYYLYTGLNTDIKNFRLNFNFLYFEAVPQDGGNKETPGSKTAARQGNSSNVSFRPPASNSNTSVPTPAQRTDPSATAILPPSGYNSSLPKNDPYSVLARSMHEKVLNSTSLATAEVEILGDPFFLVTGGTGNYNPPLETHLETIDGEAAHIVGQVLIAINFRNPIDIGPGGFMIFDSNRIPFSGVFQVTTVKNTFKDGFFYQKLNLIRIPGQLIDQNLQPTDPADLVAVAPNPKDQTRNEPIPAVDFGDRLPNNRGLPAEDVNFTNATGGLGGNQESLKNQSFGEYPSDDSLSAGSVPIGTPLPNDLSRNIRLSQEGLAELSQTSLENSSKVRETISTLLTYANPQRTSLLANELVAKELTNNLLISNPGSGIGEGAAIKITKEDLKLDQNSLSYINGLPKTLSRLNIDSVNQLTNLKSSGLLNNANEVIGSSKGTVADPNAYGARVGLDASKVSGLSSIFQSKLSKDITDYKNVPDDVNLAQSYQEGVLLEYMSSSDLQNLPANQPKTSAPNPTVNQEYINKVVAAGGMLALAKLYGVSSVDKISQSQLPLTAVSAALNNVGVAEFNPYKNLGSNVNSADIQKYSDRIISSKNQINPLTGANYIKGQNLKESVGTKFGSKGVGSNPLDKLVNNRENINTPPYTGANPLIRKNLGMPPLKS